MIRRVAVIDHGLGNMSSVRFACSAVGIDTVLTTNPDDVRAADGVVLPGVGAFGDAMRALRRRGLDDAIRDVHAAERPVLGVCLGLQLLGTSSEEFGFNAGLDIVPGKVTRLPTAHAVGADGRVPAVGWRRVERGPAWDGSPLAGLRPGAHMYFVHSFRLEPEDATVVAGISHHAGDAYCAAVSVDNVFACQFHPERSGPDGVALYRRVFEI